MEKQMKKAAQPFLLVSIWRATLIKMLITSVLELHNELTNKED